MSKIFVLVLVVMVSISMIFAQKQKGADKKTCLARGSTCIGESLECCKPTTCMFYANRCVGYGLIIPDEPQEQKKPVEKPSTCLPRGSECLGSSLQCCKPTTCMSFANRCVGDGLIIPDNYVQG